MPNPASDFFYLKTNPDDIIYQIRAIGMDGKVIDLNTLQNQVNCTALAAGVYVIEIITNSNIYRTSLMKM